MAFNIRGPDEDTHYSSSEPNESDIVNRQVGGAKLKYVGLGYLNFYIGVGTGHVISRMRNDDSALYLWEHNVWGRISRKQLEIETELGLKDRQWEMAYCDSNQKGQGQYILGQLSRQRLESGDTDMVAMEHL